MISLIPVRAAVLPISLSQDIDKLPLDSSLSDDEDDDIFPSETISERYFSSCAIHTTLDYHICRMSTDDLHSQNCSSQRHGPSLHSTEIFSRLVQHLGGLQICWALGWQSGMGCHHQRALDTRAFCDGDDGGTSNTGTRKGDESTRRTQGRDDARCECRGKGRSWAYVVKIHIGTRGIARRHGICIVFMGYPCSSRNLERTVKIWTGGFSWIEGKYRNIPGFAPVTKKSKYRSICHQVGCDRFLDLTELTYCFLNHPSCL